MKWLQRTHGIKFELVRHFLGRMLDGEWSSMPGQWQNVAVGALAMLLPAGMLLVRGPDIPGPWNAGVMAHSPDLLADRLALLTLVFAVTGLIALLQWQNLFPGRRDYLALAGLPIRPRQIFIARFAAVMLFSTALVMVINLVPSFGAPLKGAGGWRSVEAQALSGGLGCFFVLFGIMALQGCLLNLLPARWFAHVSTYVQGLLIGVLALAALYSWSIKDWTPQVLEALPRFGWWLPPVWFVGLHKALLGTADPFYARMAARALDGLAGATALMLLTYLVSYRRFRTLLIEAPVEVTPPRRRWNLLRLAAREPRQQAVMEFMARTLARSRGHRMIWLAYIGAAVAIALNSSLIDGKFLRRADGGGLLEQVTPWSSSLKFMVLFWPLSTSVILLPGMRHVLSIPAELASNWIFRLNECQGRREWMLAVERFVLLYAVAPIYAILFPVAVYAVGWPLALRMTVLQVLVSMIIFEALFQSWQQLPFTCSYVPGKRPLIAIASGYIAALGIGVPAVSMIIRAGSQFTGTFLLYMTFFAGLWLYVRRGRREGWGEARLIYEDIPWGAPSLGIAEMSYGGREEGRDSGVRSQKAGERSQEPGSGSAEPVAVRRPVAISLRAYRALARAFPYEFRNAYGEDLVHMTEDSIETIWRRPGALGLVTLLMDIAIRLPLEYLSEFRQDVRYGLRMLARSPGFTLVALVSLTLGIGVATAAFSEMNGFVLRDVPGVRKPGELVLLERPLAWPDYKRYRERGDLFSSTMVYVAPVPLGVSINGRTHRTWAHLVSVSYFETLAVHAAMGRLFGPEEEQHGRAPVVVISHAFWHDQLGSDPEAVGKVLRINGQPCTIVGVGPEDFEGASPLIYASELWLPVGTAERVTSELADNALERHDRALFHFVGRLQPGVTSERAEAEMDAVARQIEQEYGDDTRDRKGRRATLFPGGKIMHLSKQGMPFITGYFTLLGGMILLIAGSNVANMMLARATDRRKEIAVRLALGASRWRLIRQLLTECLLIAAGAGVLGLMAAWWLMGLASQIQMPVGVPFHANLEPDGRVLVFTFALTAFTALAFGLLPALQATRTDLTPALKEGGNVQLRHFRRLSLRNLLVVSQVSGSLALLLITGFLVIGHRTMLGGNPGFDTRNLYMLSFDPLRDGFTGAQAAAFYQKLLDRVQGMPAVVSATITNNVPMEAIGRPAANFLIGPHGYAVVKSARRFEVGRDFFATIGLPVVRGRGFRKEDEANDSTAVIVNEKLARVCWPDGDALGQRIEIGSEGRPGFVFPGGPQMSGARAPNPRLTGEGRVGVIVGVVKNFRDGIDMTAKELPPVMFLPLRPADMAASHFQGLTLVMRAKPGADVMGAVRREVAAMDDRITPFHPRSMQEQIDVIMTAIRGAVWTYGFIGIFGLILASVGLAGVTAYSVTQRRREIGIRMALGARRVDVLGLVMKESAALVLVGSVIGFFAARAGTRMLAALLSDVARVTGTSSSEPVLLIGAPVLLAMLGLVCCYVPARKSMRIDPAITLRTE